MSWKGFQPGDVVRLKSGGGPRMTVGKRRDVGADSRVLVVFWDGSAWCERMFDPELLVHAGDEGWELIGDVARRIVANVRAKATKL